ncbi:TPA: electron transfer flavoprotein subunit alpha [bacterium]|nr:MAG: electron transfer flavoprotein subunit alpha [Candidatus Hydrogenedentes bacterium CG1_02_42_14]PIU48482.1 MAG: electron transfer flavoprotein subunit alpha [Candidatus Hydrogenedentes bacterium CG07_land_8_20_14_0_80_42_17]HBW46335.1 electron transfer flavoprotein subunit alpha [bacterium]
MEKLLLLLHTEDDGSLRRQSLEALTSAKETAEKIGADFYLGIVGNGAKKSTELIGNCGAKSFAVLEGNDFSVPRYSTDKSAALALIKHFAATVVIAPNTSRWARALPGATFQAGGRIDTRVTGIATDGGIQIQRWYYRQRMLATLSRTQRPWVILIESGIFKAWEKVSVQVNVEEVSAELKPEMKRTESKGYENASGGEQTIKPDAPILFVAGAGYMKKQSDGKTHVKEAEELIKKFLKLSGASLGSSKSLVEAASEGAEVISIMTHMNQVGQTGSTPRHQKGLSTCCHGEEPHVIGWRFINERRAVNTDPNCGWAQGKTDVLYVADAFEVMTKLNEKWGQKWGQA